MKSKGRGRGKQRGSRLFLSHAHTDGLLAKEIANLIERVSLRHINVWYSSDNTGDGGIGVGEGWLATIRAKLEESRAVVALVTPQSVDRPWIYFESGFGAAHGELEVIPVRVGINEVPLPLSTYQTYQLSDTESTNDFLRKLLAKFDLRFDEDMVKGVVEVAVRSILEVVSKQAKSEAAREELSTSELLWEIKEHIDRRFTESTTAKTKKREAKPYSVPLKFSLPGFQVDDYLQIGAGDSVGDVLDELYRRMMDHVEPRKYLEQWILRDLAAGENLVIREMQYRVPAGSIFIPASRWEVLPLSRPYSGANPVEAHPLSWGTDKPNTEELLKKLGKLDKGQAERYRKKTGE